MKLCEIARAIDAKCINALHDNVDVKWLLTDSRRLFFPKESLFFAIKTARNDGHQFVVDLYRQGMRFFVVSNLMPEFEELTDATFLKVGDTLRSLQCLVASYRSSFSIPIIGITGSNGKTIVKEWLYQLMHYDYNITRSPRSYNSQIGVPLSVWALNEKTELGIFEAGISQPEEMKWLESMIRPTVGIFTNLGDAHQENFLSLKQKCDEKLLLFKHSEALVYNLDNKLIHIALEQSAFSGKKLSWGTSNDAWLRVLKVEKQHGITQIELTQHTTTFHFQIPFTDEASVENALHCIALLLYWEVDEIKIQERLLCLESVAMRLEMKEGIQNCLVINDSYNSDLNSLSIALDFMNQNSMDQSLKKTLILSDILQSNHDLEELYTTVANMLRSKKVDTLIAIGPDIHRYSELFSFIESHFFIDTQSFLHSGFIHQLKNQLILLKGSRQFQFEQISAKLELIVHETKLEVNLNALIENLNYFRNKLRPETKVMSMVKAYAYGSGAIEVARTLQHHRSDYLAVAVADEGAELRREGIHIPIAVMNPELGSFDLLIENNLEPEIYSFKILDSFIHALEKQGLTDYPIHIKIDSGMHRLGFEVADVPRLIERLKAQTQVKIRSVFSHLAGADEAKFDDFTRQQAAVFTQAADEISDAFSHKIMRHILNSAGTERFPEFQFDMVRIGIGHYGVSAVPGVKLSQVCSLKTIVLQTKRILAGDTVGYSRKGIVTEEKKIAILPVGYADGFDRKLSNGVGEVYVNGHRVKVIGNVSMDLLTVDVTNIPVEEGDVVEIFGEHITLSEFAGWLNTIPYEVLTSISRRVKRVYYQE